VTRDLKIRDLRFCDEILVDGNAKEAAKRAGFPAKSAHVAACRLLKNPNIQAEIDKRRQKLARKAEISVERVLEEYRRIGFSDVRRLLDADGNLLPPANWPDDAAAAVQSIQFIPKAGGVVVTKLKLWPKTDALKQLANHVGACKDKVEVSGDAKWMQLVEESLRLEREAKEGGGK
jgi:phage terminase small subunit